MLVRNLGEIKAIGFDIDGTLYPQSALTRIAFLRYVRYGEFFLHYGLTRRDLHKMDRQQDFRKAEAQIMAKRTGVAVQVIRRKLDRIIYTGLAPYFDRVSPYPGAIETIKRFKDAGFKIALLSDFPPEQKGDIWGAKQYCDVILGTESLGALKPDKYSFIKMAEALGVPCENVLYVGNSKKYDVRGCHAAGMKSAYLLPAWRRFFGMPLRESEISFNNYSQLQKLVLE